MTLNKETFWRIYASGREDDAWDFKQQLDFDDKKAFAKFLKDLLAFSNFGGGHLLLGVRDQDHELVGTTRNIDVANLGDKIERRLGFSIDVNLLYFTHTHNDSNIELGLLHIPPSEKILLPKNTLHGSDGSLIMQEGIIYYRRNTRSMPASSADVESILKRIYEKQAANTVTIQNEVSGLTALSKERRLGRFSYAAPELLAVLSNRYEINAFELGRKLWEIWKFKSRRSKHEFGKLIGIPPERIDGYFEGEEMLDLNQVIIATKMFDLPTDYFFRPTFNLQPPYWQDDIVKYAILSLVTPKARIEQINNDGSFYANVITGLA